MTVAALLFAVPQGWCAAEEPETYMEDGKTFAKTTIHEHETHGGDHEFSVKQIVLGHIVDSYEWHITDIAGRPIIVNLPVILYTEESGWHCFSSKRVHHGAEYEGFFIADRGEYATKIVYEAADGSWKRPLDLSITKTAAGLMINSSILLLLVVPVAVSFRRRKADDAAPRGVAGAVEMAVEMVCESIIAPSVGHNWRKFAPYLLTLFFFIFVNNLMGLIPIFPAGTNVTGNIAVTLVLALCTFLVINVFGSKHYWKDILWPDVPTWLKVPVPLMPVIEFVGIFTKPFSLMIRLFANIMAGHAVILILTCIIFVTAKMGAAVNGSMSAIAVLLGIFMNCLELLVAFLQAYVFTMLSSVFIGLAQEH